MEDPYASPQTVETAAAPAPDSPEAIRNEHLKHEASVKSIGTLYVLGGGLVLVASIMGLTAQLAAGNTGAAEIALGVAVVVLGAAFVFIGLDLRKLKPWVRIPVCILAAIGLLGFPIGTLINAYVLYLVLSKKGSVVLSPAYKEVIRATPHIRYRTPKWVIALLVLFVLLILFAMFADRIT